MSWQNHLGIYLMLVYIGYFLLVVKAFHVRKREVTFSVDPDMKTDHWLFFLMGLIVFVTLEVPYWIVYLCFIKN
jgi:high-affinity Fe2+/Pb2+ permease